MVLKLLLLSSFLCSVAWAGLPPTSTKASGDASFATTFQFAFPNTDITHTGTLATFGKTYVPGGGTGKGSFTANALIVGSGTSPLLSLSQGSSGQVLHSNGASLPTWAAVSLSQDVTGVTPTANGGTNFSTLSAPSALVVNVANTFSQASGATANQVLRTDGTTIGFAAVNVSTDTTGVENVVNGGTGKATLTANSVLIGNGTSPITGVAPGSSGNVLSSNGTSWTSAAPAAATANIAPVVQSFTSNGSGTFNLPYVFTVTSANATVGATYTNNGVTFTVLFTISAGTTLVGTASGAPTSSGTLTKATGTGDATIAFSAYRAPISLYVEMVGGGGGGGGGGTGDSSAATTGGNSTFGTSLLTATGGGRTTWGSSAAGGGGGTINLPAYGKVISGGTGNAGQNLNNAAGGGGGTSMFGGGGGAGLSGSGASAAVVYGSAGGGAGSPTTGTVYSGGGGGGGGGVQAFIPGPLSATYSYTVGAGGAAGTALGTGSRTGAAGVDGAIFVTAFY